MIKDLISHHLIYFFDHVAMPTTISAREFPDFSTILLAVASRCRKGLATASDAEALEEIARHFQQEVGKQIQNQSA